MPVNKTYKLKPLKWEKRLAKTFETYDATNSFGTYRVERKRAGYNEEAPWESWVFYFCFTEHFDEGRMEVSSLKAGKEAALKDWHSRILQELIEVN